MNQFTNNPLVRNVDGVEQRGTYVHQPLSVDHYGYHMKIQENGRVVITSNPILDPVTKELDFDEIEVPASLVFKLAGLLKATRTVQFINQSATAEKV